ncbi:hypothetical protein AKG43_01350 [Neisseria sp. 74A18]|nr:hypothetical protein AKG43_01350 [Neisseria sp. 74A18]
MYTFSNQQAWLLKSGLPNRQPFSPFSIGLFRKDETFAKPPDVDAVQGVAAQRVQTYHIDRQTSEQRATQKCAADGGFCKGLKIAVCGVRYM